MANPQPKFQEGAPRLVAKPNCRGFSVGVAKPEPDAFSLRVNSFRKQFISAVKRGDRDEAKLRIVQIHVEVVRAVIEGNAPVFFDIQSVYCDDNGTSAMVLASASRDTQMAQLLHKNSIGFEPKVNNRLLSLAFREKPERAPQKK